MLIGEAKNHNYGEEWSQTFDRSLIFVSILNFIIKFLKKVQTKITNKLFVKINAQNIRNRCYEINDDKSIVNQNKN